MTPRRPARVALGVPCGFSSQSPARRWCGCSRHDFSELPCLGADRSRGKRRMIGYVIQISGLIRPNVSPFGFSTTYPGNGGPSQYYIGEVPSLGVVTPLTGVTFVSVGQSSRTYALEVTTPEPGFYGLLGLQLSGLVIVTVVSRRRKRRFV